MKHYMNTASLALRLNKPTILTALVFGFTIVSGAIAHAEGSHHISTPNPWSGAYGVNRVVATLIGGYIEVEGTFSVSATLPSRVGPNNANVRDHDNRPNPYLGGRVDGVEFDGGLIWEPEADTDIQGNLYPPGWAAFIRGGGVFTNPKIWKDNKSQAWRLAPPAPANPTQPWQVQVNSLLNFAFEEDGRVSLRAGVIPYGNGRFYHNGVGIVTASATDLIAPTLAQSAPVIDPDDLESTLVKRVIALTRAGGPNDTVGYHDELDGTVMTGRFTGGQIRQIGELALRNWDNNDVNQSRTGYDAAPDQGQANNFRAWDLVTRTLSNRYQRSYNPNTNALLSRRVIEFPAVNVNGTIGSNIARADVLASHEATEGGFSRYTQETVQINLRAAGAPQGRGR